MSCSKIISSSSTSDTLDIKVHYVYHGIQRCGLVDACINELYGMDYLSFMDFLKSEIPQLNKFDQLRACFLDDEGTYIDLTVKNFHRFIRLATCCFQSEVPKMNIKILEGASPVASKSIVDQPAVRGISKRSLDVTAIPEFDPEEYLQTTYNSPVELEIKCKRKEVDTKEQEFRLLEQKYDMMWAEMNPAVYQDSSKSVCTRCHLRMGHSKNRCHMTECTSASVCGQLDRHQNEKRELQEVGKRKHKAEGELKALRSELEIKQTVSNEMAQSFESKVHDILIRTNPTKYLTQSRRPKEGVILADSFILKKYYGTNKPDKTTLQRDSEIFQTIIGSYEERMYTNKNPKNSVIKELERRGINWPSTNSQFAEPGVPKPQYYSHVDQNIYPQARAFMYPNSPYLYGFNSVPFCPAMSPPLPTGAVATPPPPPPSPPGGENVDKET